eukprot:6597260-Lingulodinium_polyedra.AAC.1
MRPDMLRCNKSWILVPLVRSSGCMNPESTWYRQQRACMQNGSLVCSDETSGDSSTNCSLSLEVSAATARGDSTR